MDRDKARELALTLVASATSQGNIGDLLKRAEAFENWLTRDDKNEPKAQTGTGLSFGTADQTLTLNPSSELWNKLVRSGKVKNSAYRYFLRSNGCDVYRVLAGAGLDAPAEYYDNLFSTWKSASILPTYKDLFESEKVQEVDPA